MWLPAEETSSMDGQVPDTCSGGVLSTVFICLQDLCGIDTQDQVMDQMKNIHFIFKKTCLQSDFDEISFMCQKALKHGLIIKYDFKAINCHQGD